MDNEKIDKNLGLHRASKREMEKQAILQGLHTPYTGTTQPFVASGPNYDLGFYGKNAPIPDLAVGFVKASGPSRFKSGSGKWRYGLKWSNPQNNRPNKQIDKFVRPSKKYTSSSPQYCGFDEDYSNVLPQLLGGITALTGYPNCTLMHPTNRANRDACKAAKNECKLNQNLSWNGGGKECYTENFAKELGLPMPDYGQGQQGSSTGGTSTGGDDGMDDQKSGEKTGLSKNVKTALIFGGAVLVLGTITYFVVRKK
tara:strand:- start:1915 stop:2679 length:765 start_codon:yes stop_codon:yes gene_type:complete